MMIKLLKFIPGFLSLIIVIVLLYFNIKLYTAPDIANKNSLKKDVILQLNFLENQLKHFDLGKKMQQQYPEGFVFIHVLYGLSYCEIARSENKTSAGFQKAMTESHYAFDQINSSYAKINFNPAHTPAYGIFYRGWQNYLLGKMLSVQPVKDSSDITMYQANCNDISHAILQCPGPYPESYKDAAWPADVFVAMASLQLHDQLFKKKYDTLIQNWLTKVKAYLDPYSKMVPHSAGYPSATVDEGARGSSASLILLFLSEIDPEFAQQQFQLYKKYFLMKRLGLPCIREYPAGTAGSGDLDSGPILLDMSFPGSIVAVGTFQKFGDHKMAAKISANIESFGVSHTSSGEKKFLFGTFPMADAFIAWSRLQTTSKLMAPQQNSTPYGTAIWFHVLSAMIILLLVLGFKRMNGY